MYIKNGIGEYVINFKDIEIDERKIDKLVEYINGNNDNILNDSEFLEESITNEKNSYLLNIEDNFEIKNEKENIIINKDIIINDEYIIIEYVNISVKIKLFIKKFIENNKENIIIEDISEDESKAKQIEFKSEQEFEPNKRAVK